ncbi:MULTISPECIES: DNA-directed RNA polymerase subunit alpha [Dehalococcoides]|uniref:DNA-directed RNA polymerase subunit alpha n=1 Tax=Dehalococcoides TaxID=61434 RepID=UPI0003C863CA|nr:MULTISPECIES: DNA-directed RNA polymerase subunit alpha [Dehalococcoides]AHB13211.1 DNA-directed RNA polymerase subunit alpha [Dehalococcoides mccartyi GY50]AII57647.1 DNA-directed RNA polymerase subunit alpha [Dehalococcoides mccartyi CG1]APH12130.1 DNA-directed RNA polymerase subunit alpha [Dehalococcoides mccartyi]QYY58265.1 DNA-directed RNA polymerase subunit alpha [Dehalococcoides mccartyi]BAQ34389.1 DNA-directed RNA polymerase subunit alpha [Dehalococcoides sp. UCH007]
MSDLAIPTISCTESDGKYGRFVVEPLEKGFGTTMGNSLRRILLSYLDGVAITRVRIDGIQHEFSALPKAKEDTLDFLLNLKNIRVESLSGLEGILYLRASGSKVVTAADIEPSNDFAVVNPELYLLTLDSDDAVLNVELEVELGRGYRPPESTENTPIGTIPVDAIFTPIRKVNFTTEPMHVGRETSLERLVLEVWTDGTVEPATAVSRSADILVKQFAALVSHSKVVAEVEASEPVKYAIPEEKYNMPIEQLDLSVRAVNCLRHAGITTVGEVINRGTKELLTLRNFGLKSLTELEDRLKTIGLSLNPEDELFEDAENTKKKNKGIDEA